jgi:exosortase B
VATLTNSLPENSWKPLWPILLGLCLLYLPTFYTFANTIWKAEDQAHAPMILIAVLYIFWQKRAYLTDTIQQKIYPYSGWLILIFGLLVYLVGRTQNIRSFEIGSLLPVLLGALLMTRGISSIKKLWFPLLFLLFVIPLPAALIDGLTGPLKQLISELVEIILYWVGYPIARSGVTLSIGPYQLLVADACSGLNSMFSLSAMGLLYLYVMHHSSWLRNGIIIASLLPIAFVANILRVMILVLLTYHFGDEVGQGFLHEFAGVLLFFASLIFILALDWLLGWIFPKVIKAESR